MEKYFSKVLPSPPLLVENGEGSKQDSVEVILTNLSIDIGFRSWILNYHPNIRDQVRRVYLLKGSCQPRNHNFSFKENGKTPPWRFVPLWFEKHKTLLEYNIEKILHIVSIGIFSYQRLVSKDVVIPLLEMDFQIGGSQKDFLSMNEVLIVPIIKLEEIVMLYWMKSNIFN